MSVRFISYLCSRIENKMGNSKIKSSLVKTDYDNFKDMRFFVEQQRKAQEMMREVEDFQRSFIMSKFISMKDYVRENPMYGYNVFRTFSFRYYENEKSEPVGVIEARYSELPIYRRKGKFEKTLNISSYHKPIYVDMTLEEEKLLDNLYFALYGQIEINCVDNKLFSTSKYVNKNEKFDYYDEHAKSVISLNRTPFIIDGWEQFVDMKAVKQYIKKNPNALQNFIKGWKLIWPTKDCDDWQGYRYIKDEEGARAVLEERFKDAIALHKKFYYADVEGTAKRKCCGWCTPEDKCYILWEGMPRFVSPTPEKYESIINNDNTITFTFKYQSDENDYNQVYLYETKLTYSIDNNELLKYE